MYNSFFIVFEDFNLQTVDSLTVSMTQRSGYCECGCRRVSLGFCYDGKKCACVCACLCVFKRGESWQDGHAGENAAVDCDVSAPL